MSAELDAPELTPEQVRARFDDALRRGQPRWLWPEVSIPRWQAALGEIERAARAVLTEGCFPVPLGADPAALGIAAYTSGMGPLLGFWLRDGAIAAGAEAAAVLELHLEHNTCRMERMAAYAAETVAALARHGVAATLLKGMDTAWTCFPDPATRPLSDIDVLVDPDDEECAEGVLAGMGFEPGVTAAVPRQRIWRPAGLRSEPRSLAFVHADDPWAIDLQMSLNRRYSAGAPVIRLDELHDPAECFDWPLAFGARTLGEPLLALQLACHAGSGLFSLTLLRMVELVLVIRRDTASGELEWSEFLAAANRAGALGGAWPALGMTEALAPGTVPREVLAACEADAPREVRRVVAGLSPATAHRVTRCSLAERFMWTSTPMNRLRLVVQDVFLPQSPSLAAFLRVYRQRAWRLAHGTLTRQ